MTTPSRDALEDVRKALINLVRATDAMHRHDAVVRELNRHHVLDVDGMPTILLSAAITQAINEAVGVLDATSC